MGLCLILFGLFRKWTIRLSELRTQWRIEIHSRCLSGGVSAGAFLELLPVVDPDVLFCLSSSTDPEIVDFLHDQPDVMVLLRYIKESSSSEDDIRRLILAVEKKSGQLSLTLPLHDKLFSVFRPSHSENPDRD